MNATSSRSSRRSCHFDSQRQSFLRVDTAQRFAHTSWLAYSPHLDHWDLPTRCRAHQREQSVLARLSFLLHQLLRIRLMSETLLSLLLRHRHEATRGWRKPACTRKLNQWHCREVARCRPQSECPRHFRLASSYQKCRPCIPQPKYCAATQSQTCLDELMLQ